MDKDLVAKVAHLARIKTTDDENEKFAGDLSAIFEMIKTLESVDTDNVEPMTSAIPHEGHWRADKVTDGGIQDKVTANAPESTEGFFVVPKVIE